MTTPTNPDQEVPFEEVLDELIEEAFDCGRGYEQLSGKERKDWGLPEIKQAIRTALLTLIGEDEPISSQMDTLNGTAAMARNEIRQSLRAAIEHKEVK